jgi:hypothetical protein
MLLNSTTTTAIAKTGRSTTDPRRDIGGGLSRGA